MNFSDLDAQVLATALPQFGAIQFVAAGGQKRVFSCLHEGIRWILKVTLVSDKGAGGDELESGDDSPLDSAAARARREVAVLRSCDSPHVVSLGPLDLETLKIENLSLLYYLEEFIPGEDLSAELGRVGRLAIEDVVKLGIDVARAIDALWNCGGGHQVVHRDVKPANIMRRQDGSFVLLDVGLAYDQLHESISSPGGLTGSVEYAAPEQLGAGSKRQYDYRLDLFSLGVVLYKASTGAHPFVEGGHSITDTFQAILRKSPDQPRDVADVPAPLSTVIMRLLAKKPHLRFRTCGKLIDALQRAREET